MSFKMLLYGESGVGKTYSLPTLLEAGYKVRLLAAENNAILGTEVALKARDKPTPKGDFALMIPPRPKKTLLNLVQSHEDFLRKTLDSQYKVADPKRRTYTRYLEVIRSTTAFIDTATNENHGSVDDWGEDTVFVIDSLTILCEAISQATVGGKLAISQPEWGVMQGTLVEFLRQLTENLTCNFVLIGHPTKDIDPLSGSYKLYPSSLGRALNSKLSTIFTEVVFAYKESKKFYWSTDHPQAVTRVTLLPMEGALKPSFTNLPPRVNSPLRLNSGQQ